MGRKSQFSPEFKAEVALAALKEDKTLQELAKQYNIAPSKITEWKQEAVANMKLAFAPAPPKHDREVEQLKREKDTMLKKIGQLELEVDFFAGACEEAGLASRGKR